MFLPDTAFISRRKTNGATVHPDIKKKKKSCLVSTKKSPRKKSGETTGSEPKYHVISDSFLGFGAGGKRNSGISTIVFENLIFIWVLTMEASVLLGY